MRRMWLALAFLSLLLPGSAPGATTWFVRGAGFGHGVGMSQYGAQGYALHGWAARDILTHYFPGTTLATVASPDVRVLVAERRASVAIGSAASFSVTDAGAHTYALAAGARTLTAAMTVKDVHGAAHTLASPALFRPGTSPLTVDGRAYRGAVRLHASAGKLDAVDEVGVEGYLKGVVPQEMPASWAANALQVQAVAARSYALATRRSSGIFDLYADTRSQVYGGLAAEAAATNRAVDATAGQVLTTPFATGAAMDAGGMLTLGDPVALTYFGSTSGGRTAAVQDGLPGSAPAPYLVSVDDPYDSISPHHRWGPGDAETDCPGTSPDCVYDGTKMSALLGVDARDLTVHRNPSERVATVTVTTPGGATELAGTTLRTKLGLRSTWFTLGLLSLSPAQTTITYGDDDPLAYRTHDLGTVALERKRYRQPWARVQDLPAAAGTITGHPVIKTAYRLTSSEGTGASILVQVRPRLTLRRTATGLAGTVRPTSLAGTGAALQKRRSDGVWVTVARATVGRTGAFSARLRVTRGAYRARLVPAATSGFVTGTSATLTV